jgi:tetratricopeptide (TPR) repeat protein
VSRTIRPGPGRDAADRTFTGRDTAPAPTVRDDDADPTIPAGTPSAGRERGDGLLAGRYEVVEYLARGGFGRVERGRDTLTGEDVAIKWIPVGSTLDLVRARREVTTLRWLRLPGVVRLRDDGTTDDGWFLIMDLVRGEPFPGRDAPARWDTIAEPTLALLETLARVHNAGIVHADLKPGNVLVTPDGQVAVLDFGISSGRALPLLALRGTAGTPGYMAPERWEGAPADVRSDLYAVGVMVLEALTGWQDVAELPGADAPPEVVALVRRLLAENPADRPESADAAIAALGRPPPAFADRLPRDRPATEAELRTLFAGPEPFLHLPSEAARILLARTRGEREAVVRELGAWIRGGLAHTADGRIHVDRQALEALDEDPEEDRLRTLLREHASTARIVAEALRLATHWVAEGRPQRAISVLEAALPLARDSGDAATEDELLRLWALAALIQETPTAISRARCEIGRSPAPRANPDVLDRLLHAADAALAGNGVLADELLADISGFADEQLEIWRAGVRVRAARPQGREPERLDELEAWAKTPLRRAMWMGWLGNLRYREGRYAEAAELHLASIPGRALRSARLSSQRNAAEALVEVPDLARARELAEAVASEARMCGHVKYEADAIWVVRTVAYRLGEATEAREDLVAAARSVRRFAEALFALTEGAVALRLGDRATAARLGSLGEAAFTEVRHTGTALLCRAIAMAARGATRAELDDLCARAETCPIPDFRVQVLGLARLATPDPDPAWRDRAVTHAACRPVAEWDIRLDVLSFAEAIAPVPSIGA